MSDLTFDENLRVVLSKRLKTEATRTKLPCSLLDAEGLPLRVPTRFPPLREAMEYHRENIYSS